MCISKWSSGFNRQQIPGKTGARTSAWCGIEPGLVSRTPYSAKEVVAAHIYHYAEAESTREYQDGQQHPNFLLSHPDNNWCPEFQKLARRSPLPNNLVGASQWLRTLTVWWSG